MSEPASKPRVFISHATADRTFVESQLIPCLNERQIETWYSKTDIQGGDNWHASIAEGLDECDWFLVVLSPTACNSKWVRHEVEWALSQRDGRLVPVMYQDCDPASLHFALGALQYIDFRPNYDLAKSQLVAKLVGEPARQASASSRRTWTVGRRPMLVSAAVAAILCVAVVLWFVKSRQPAPMHPLGLDEDFRLIAEPVADVIKRQGAKEAMLSLRFDSGSAASSARSSVAATMRLNAAFNRLGIQGVPIFFPADISFGCYGDVVWIDREGQAGDGDWLFKVQGTLYDDDGLREDWKAASSDSRVQLVAGRLDAVLPLTEKDVAELFGPSVDLRPSDRPAQRAARLRTAIRTSRAVADGAWIRSDETSPVRIQFQVDRVPLAAEWNPQDERIAVMPDLGQACRLVVQNESNKDLAMWLNINGLSSFTFYDPDAGTPPEVYLVPKQQTLEIDGWYKSSTTVQPFVLSRENAPKIYQATNYDLICVFAAAWIDGQGAPSGEPLHPSPVMVTTRETVTAAANPGKRYRTGVVRSVVAGSISERRISTDSPFAEPMPPPPTNPILNE